MAKTNFENAKSFPKAHPDAQPVTRHQREAGDFIHQPALDRHRRKCQICHHPDRREIEGDFLRWRSLREIATSFGLADPTSVWRHASATGLRDERQRRIAYALHPLLEQSEDTFIKATPSAIISAVRTYSQINDEGRRVRSKPVEKIYFVDRPSPRRSGDVDVSSHSPLATRHCTSNRNIQELEDDSTR